MILRIVDALTPYISAKSVFEYLPVLYNRLMRFFITKSIFDFLTINPVRKACCTLALAVTSSKFSSLLSVLIPFLWLICRFLGIGSLKYSQINRCARIDLPLMPNCAYPYTVNVGFKRSAFVEYTDHTLEYLST